MADRLALDVQQACRDAYARVLFDINDAFTREVAATHLRSSLQLMKEEDRLLDFRVEVQPTEDYGSVVFRVQAVDPVSNRVREFTADMSKMEPQ